MEGDVVAQFTEVTGSTPDLAIQYLQICDFNIEQATMLYFENGGAPLTEEPTSHGGYDDGDDVLVDETRSTPRQSNTENDEAMARRLQEEMYGSRGGTDSVRAPMARTTETLVDDDYDTDMHSDLLRELRYRDSRNGEKGQKKKKKKKKKKFHCSLLTCFWSSSTGDL